MSTVRQQLRGVESSILTTDRSISRLEDLIVKLDENDPETVEAERQLAHLHNLKRSLEALRASLVKRLENLGEDAG
jgi:hypothetical protein